MGTRSLTIPFDCWLDNNNQMHHDEICVMYRQMDGYVSGMGRDLVEFFQNKIIVNGFGRNRQEDFNGTNCLAAALVAHFKDGIGNIYLHPANTRDIGEEYIYKITTSDNETIDIEVCERQGWGDNNYKELPGHFILKHGKPTKWFVKQCTKE